jgi:hypothetical protein
MGFRSLALQKRSSEVWQLLGGIKKEFETYGAVVTTLSKQLTSASNSVEKLGTRAKVMSRKLKDVELLSDQQSSDRLLGLSADEILDDCFEEAAPLVENAASEIIVRTSRPDGPTISRRSATTCRCWNNINRAIFHGVREFNAVPSKVKPIIHHGWLPVGGDDWM